MKSMRKQSVQSKMGRNHFDSVGFSLETKKQAYSKTLTSRDGLITVTYSSPVVCGVKEMKVSCAMVHQCIGHLGQERLIRVNEQDRRRWVRIDLGEIACHINGRNGKLLRNKVLESIVRIRNMDIYVVRKPTAIEVDQAEQGKYINWVYDINVDDVNDPNIIEVELSESFINIISKDGIAYNMTQLMQYNGRAALLYYFMQAYKFKHSKTGQYRYFNYIPHVRLVEVLELEGRNFDSNPRRIDQRIRETFKEIGLNYKPHINKKGERLWRKEKL